MKILIGISNIRFCVVTQSDIKHFSFLIKLLNFLSVSAYLRFQSVLTNICVVGKMMYTQKKTSIEQKCLLTRSKNMLQSKEFFLIFCFFRQDFYSKKSKIIQSFCVVYLARYILLNYFGKKYWISL